MDETLKDRCNNSPRKRLLLDTNGQYPQVARKRAKQGVTSDINLEVQNDQNHGIIINQEQVDENDAAPNTTLEEVAGRIAEVELENFMCHGNLKIQMMIKDNNCFYIGGPNGSGKSAIFASLNIGLGGKGNNNDRGSSVKNYIKDGKSRAKIRIVLTNRGQGEHPDYGDYAVVERSISHSGSTYVLKTIREHGEKREETIVSKKKKDLDRLLVRYGIQLNNPVFWMSQDRSRHFLQQMKPDKLYQIFMSATELDHIKECYEMCESLLNDVDRISAKMKVEFEKKKREYHDMLEERKKLRGIKELRQEQSALGWTLLWCPLRDVSVKIRLLEEKMKKHLEEHNFLKHRILKNRQERQEYVEQVNKINEQLEEYAVELYNTRENVRRKEEALKNIKNSITELNTQKQTMDNQKRCFQQRIKDIAGEVDNIRRRSQSQQRLTDATNARRKLDSLREEEIHSLEQLRINQQEKKETQEDSDQTSENLDNLCKIERKLMGQLSLQQKELQRAEDMSMNSVARFGKQMPRILEVLRDNIHCFEFPPIGPIGLYVGVRDQKWAFAIEEALRSQITSFIFNSKGDQTVFENLMRANRIGGRLPSRIISKFSVALHDVRANEPSQDWDTILRMMTFSDGVVRNVLIDMLSIESIILLETDDYARKIMDGNCPENCMRAYTRTGGQAYGRTNRGSGQYRFYACRFSPRVQYLTDRINIDKAGIETEITKLKNEYETIKVKIDEIRLKRDQNNKRLHLLQSKITNIENNLKNLRNDIRIYDRKVEDLADRDDDDLTIQNLHASSEEFENRIAELDAYLSELEEVLKDKDVEGEELESARKKARNELNLCMKKVDVINNELEKVRYKIDELDASNERYENHQKKLNKIKLEFDDEQLDLDKQKDHAELKAKESAMLPTPTSMTVPPDFTKLPPTKDVEKEYGIVTTRINAAEKMVDRSITAGMLSDFRNNFEEGKKYYSKLKRFGQRLADCVSMRLQKFPVMRHAITMRLKTTFQKLMAIRQYSGDMMVDNNKKVINITVATHKKNIDDRTRKIRKDDVVQDLKGLSGGERSYTTACFIMALWDTMEAPFRCMDEFDVFMDMVNRKLIMELLAKLATEQYSHNQFIFFTPQGIKELGKKDRVQVFDMPKVRT